jgi:hypothetical protein
MKLSADDFIVLDVVDFHAAVRAAPRDHVGFAEAREVAETHDLPIEPDRAQGRGTRDVIVLDVVDVELAGIAVAQQHVVRVVAEKAAEAGNRPIGPDRPQLVRRQERVVADVVDVVLAVAAVTHDQSGRGGGRRSRVGRGRRGPRRSAPEAQGLRDQEVDIGEIS